MSAASDIYDRVARFGRVERRGVEFLAFRVGADDELHLVGSYPTRREAVAAIRGGGRDVVR